MKHEIPDNIDVVLDGFPRKISQAQWLIDNYAERFDIYVLYLSVSKDILIQRINKRIVEGSKRADDASPEIIRKRLDNYFKITIPAIDWLSKLPDVHFFEIDANGSIEENYSDIITALGLL
jgi:adenylate kinase family enzyme